VTIVAFLRKLGRKLMPPGNRGSYDSEWKQPDRPPVWTSPAARPRVTPARPGSEPAGSAAHPRREDIAALAL